MVKLQRQNVVVRGVGAFIFCITTRRFLFLLRDKSSYSNTWGLAGGKVNVDENLTESLTRELEEELGYDFAFAKIIPLEKFTSVNRSFQYNTFLLPVTSEFTPTLNPEHKGFCWVRLEDCPKPLHPGVWRTIQFKEIIAKIKTLELML